MLIKEIKKKWTTKTPTTPQTHVSGIQKWSNAHLLDPSLACEFSIPFYTMFNTSNLNLYTKNNQKRFEPLRKHESSSVQTKELWLSTHLIHGQHQDGEQKEKTQHSTIIDTVNNINYPLIWKRTKASWRIKVFLPKPSIIVERLNVEDRQMSIGKYLFNWAPFYVSISKFMELMCCNM